MQTDIRALPMVVPQKLRRPSLLKRNPAKQEVLARAALLQLLRKYKLFHPAFVMYEPVDLRPFRPISLLHEKFYPRNINHIPVVKFFVCLDLERKSS